MSWPRTPLCRPDRPSSKPRPGKVSGVTSGGVHVFKGIPYGASTAGANRFLPPRKPEPWTGVREAIAYAGRSPQAAAARAAAGAGDGVGTGRHAAGRRGLPDAARLDARPRQRQAAGHGVAAWRRLLLRLGQLAALRQHQPRPAQRRRGGGRQPSPQYLRPSRSVAASAASASPNPAMSACSIWCRRWNGCASTPRASAAIRATSRSSASRAAAER